ncbi:hypothetical protein GT204_18420 [Streptomyces sp. SID4919]|uniref:SUKH-4 family immunity protein n=1 Tax=unclassified Streptomyces TaxID=2593676 RepID=UPI000823C6F5|nr:MULTISPECIES: SUKH-4 family immunity protein [unclassified Streptomyces]MYY10831.1 hypothetical protein [Streptomyces sp. SID4919]SCK60757.1 SUKH-4 immunity protein [Streptomyces sp. AmelKG-E11A]
MATTETIRFTEHGLPPSLTHAGTRRFLTGAGLPAREGPLFRFAVLREQGLRTYASLAEVPAAPRDLFVLGELSAPGSGTWVTLDGRTGALFLTGRPHPGRADPGLPGDPLAPDTGTLLGFESAVADLERTRGRFAAYESRYGRAAASGATDELLTLFQGGMRGAELPAFWWIAALILPLARVPTPGIQLRLDLPGRLLDDEFGAGRVTRCEDADLPAALTHEPTRRFLKDIGLPEEDDSYVFPGLPLRTLTEHHGGPAGLPPHATRLVPVGHLADGTDIVVDGATGEILSWHRSTGRLSPLNSDVSALAFTTWLLRRERVLDEAHDGYLTARAPGRLAEAVRAVLRATDHPAALHTPTDTDGPAAHWRPWPLLTTVPVEYAS